MRGIDPGQLVIDSAGWPMLMAKPERVQLAATEEVAEPSAPPPARRKAVSNRPIGGEVLTLAEVSAALGLTPDETAELILKLSVPRIVGFPARNVSELRAKIRSGAIKIDRGKQ